MNNENEEIEEANLEEKVSQKWEEVVTSEANRLQGMEKRVTDEISDRRDFSLISLLKRVKNSFRRLVGNLNPLQRYAVAGGAVAAVIIGLLMGWFLSPSVNKEGRTVIFEIPASNAENVELAGDFSGFEPLEMEDKNSDGTWTLRLKLEEGKYEYYYLVNGEKKSARYPLADEIVRDWDDSKNGIRYVGDEEPNDSEKRDKAQSA